MYVCFLFELVEIIILFSIVTKYGWLFTTKIYKLMVDPNLNPKDSVWKWIRENDADPDPQHWLGNTNFLFTFRKLAEFKTHINSKHKDQVKECIYSGCIFTSSNNSTLRVRWWILLGVINSNILVSGIVYHFGNKSSTSTNHLLNTKTPYYLLLCFCPGLCKDTICLKRKSFSR